MTTRLESAELILHGQTTLNADYATQARLEFSHFNIDSLLKLAHVKALSGESALAGTVTFQGPLAHPEQLRGEARLQELNATVAGVHLKSQGGVHATLADERVRLDPLHITGEDTDLRVQGNLALEERASSTSPPVAPSTSSSLKLSTPTSPQAVQPPSRLRRMALSQNPDSRGASISRTELCRLKTFPTASASCTARSSSTRIVSKSDPSPP